MIRLNGSDLTGTDLACWLGVLLLHPEAILLCSGNTRFDQGKLRAEQCVRVNPQTGGYGCIFATWAPYDLNKWKGRCRIGEGL